MSVVVPVVRVWDCRRCNDDNSGVSREIIDTKLFSSKSCLTDYDIGR